MKKGVKVMFIMILMCLITGCYKVNTNMSINSDKSVNLEMIYAVDVAMMESMAESMSDGMETETDVETEIDVETETDYSDAIESEAIKAKLEPKGYKVEAYALTEGEKNWQGVKITKTFANIDEISKSTDIKFDFNKIVDPEEALDDSQLFSLNNGKYKATFLFDLTEDENSESGMDLKSMSSYFDLKYVLTLPNESLSNNATKVSEDGKSLTWNLEIGKTNEVKFEFELPSETNNIIIPIAIGSGVIVLALIFGLIVGKSKKNKPEVAPQQPVQPQQPQQPDQPQQM